MHSLKIMHTILASCGSIFHGCNTDYTYLDKLLLQSPKFWRLRTGLWAYGPGTEWGYEHMAQVQSETHVNLSDNNSDIITNSNAYKVRSQHHWSKSIQGPHCMKAKHTSSQHLFNLETRRRSLASCEKHSGLDHQRMFGECWQCCGRVEGQG